MKTQYQAAIIGYGNMGRWHHIGVCQTPRIRITGAYDILPERRELAVQDGLTVFDTLDGLLADSHIDIVIVATPNSSHKPLTCAALEAGKAVICEKPAAMTVEEMEAMTRTAQKHGRLLTVYQNRRRDPDFTAVRQAVESGILGRVFDLQSCVTACRGIPPGWRRYAAEGGGMMRDWGVHLIDQLLELFPFRVISVFCCMSHISGYGCEDGFRLLLTFENALTASVLVGTSHCVSPPRWMVFGDKGGLVISDWESEGKIVLRPKTDDYSRPIAYNKAGPTRTMAPGDASEIIPVIPGSADYPAFYPAFAAALDGSRPLEVTPEQVLRVLRIMEAAFEAHNTGQVVSGIF